MCQVLEGGEAQPQPKKPRRVRLTAAQLRAQARVGGGQAHYALQGAHGGIDEESSVGSGGESAEGIDGEEEWFDEFYDSSSSVGEDEQSAAEEQHVERVGGHGQQGQQGELGQQQVEQAEQDQGGGQEQQGQVGQQREQQEQHGQQQEEQRREEIFASEAQNLQSCTPGNDGSKYVKRASKKTWLPSSLTEADKEEFRGYLWSIFQKYVDCNETQVQVERHLAMRFPYESVVIRSNMPTTFEEFLNALEQLGLPVASFTHDYDICPCGFVYR